MNNCPNCGSQIIMGDKFCRVCGTNIISLQNNINQNYNQQILVNQQNNIQAPMTFEQQQMTNPLKNEPHYVPVTDDDLINEYIGNNYKELKAGGFSFCTLFFGFIYLMYRQMYLLGIIWIAINALCVKFLPTYTFIVSGLISISLSIMFKSLYLKKVRNKVEKIKQQNQNLDSSELRALCRQRGGTSAAAVILILLIYAIVFYMSYSVMYDLIKDILNKQIELNSDLIINIPDNLKETGYSEYEYKVYQNDTLNGSDCSLIIQSIDANNLNRNIERDLNSSINHEQTDNYSGIIKKEINNNEWYYASLKNNKSEKYYYSIEHNDVIYKITFTINSDYNGTCAYSHESVINSLDFK